MGLIQYYQITCQIVNQAICIFIIMPIVFCNLVSIKCIIFIIIIIMSLSVIKNNFRITESKIISQTTSVLGLRECIFSNTILFIHL